MAGPTTGNLTKAFMTLGTAWGTADAPASTEGMIINMGGSFSYAKPPFMAEQSDQPQAKTNAVTSGLVSASKTIPFNLNYNELRPFALVLGNGTTYATPVEQTVSQGDYLHVLTAADDIYGLFATYAEQHGSVIETWPSCKATRFMISGEAGADLHMRGELEMVGYDKDLANGVISSSDFTSLTYPTITDVLFDQLVFRINDASGSALAGGDAAAIKSMAFSYARVLATDLYDNASAPYIIEPPNNGIAFDVINLNVVFNYFNTAMKDFIADLKTPTTKKFDLTWTGAQIGTGDNHTVLIECPCAHIVDTADSGSASSSGLLPASMTLNIVRPADALTSGMTFADAVKLSVTNTTAAKQLS